MDSSTVSTESNTIHSTDSIDTTAPTRKGSDGDHAISLKETVSTTFSDSAASESSEPERTPDIDEWEIPIQNTTKSERDMTLVLILLAMLLLCIFMGSLLLWICVNVVKLQRESNQSSYSILMPTNLNEMDPRTPDYFAHAKAPSSPSYYRSEIDHSKHKDFQRG